MQETITKHFENVKVGLTMGLQRGIFGDFETVVAMKYSLDVIEKFIKDSVVAVPVMMPKEKQEPLNHLQSET